MIKKGIALSLTAMLLFAIAAPMAMAMTRDEYKATGRTDLQGELRSERQDPQNRSQGSQGKQAEDGRGQIHQGLERSEEDLQRAEGGRTAGRRRGEADQVARLRQDRGRPVQERRQRAQGGQQVEGAEVRQQTDAEREQGQLHGARVQLPLLQVRTVQIHLRGSALRGLLHSTRPPGHPRLRRLRLRRRGL